MSGEEFVKLLADARAEFERIGKRVRISADGDGYQVNLIQGEDDWDLISCEESAGNAEFIKRAIVRFVQNCTASRSVPDHAATVVGAVPGTPPPTVIGVSGTNTKQTMDSPAMHVLGIPGTPECPKCHQPAAVEGQHFCYDSVFDEEVPSAERRLHLVTHRGQRIRPTTRARERQRRNMVKTEELTNPKSCMSRAALPGTPEEERKAFEAWRDRQFGRHSSVRLAWLGWQAGRAALREQAGTVEEERKK